jgi:hypothetical protein
VVLELSSRLGNLQFVQRVRTHPERRDASLRNVHSCDSDPAGRRPDRHFETRSRSQAALGPDGSFVMVPVTYQCDFVDGMIFISVQVRQSRGNRIANGSGSFQGSCTSNQQTALVEVQSFSGVPYHRGKAVARAFASTFTGSASDGPEAIQID